MTKSVLSLILAAIMILGITFYEVSFKVKGTGYEYIIEAFTGEILKSHIEQDDRPTNKASGGAERRRLISHIKEYIYYEDPYR